MNFCSDNVSGASPEIIDAIARANEGAAMPYGEDALTDRLRQRFNDIFETDVTVFPVATGTAANALALSTLAPPFGAIFCHEESHAWEDECGAPEFYSGAKLVPLASDHCKLAPDGLNAALGRFQVGFVHHAQPAAITLSQATEAGTIYSLDETRAIADLCRPHDLKLHMDGARFANALVSLGCNPADATWRAGLGCAVPWGHQERRIGGRGGRLLRPGLGQRFWLSAKTRRPPLVEDAVPVGPARRLPQ